MKKLITLMAFGVACASLGAETLNVTDADKTVSGPTTYVRVPGTVKFNLENRYTFKPTGDFSKVYMAYIDAEGNELKAFDIIGSKAEDGTYTLVYTDMARLANGYTFAFRNENLEKEYASETLASDLSESVNWSDSKRLNLTPYLQGKTLKAGDVIIVHCSETGNKHGQLWWSDGGEVKYGNSADASKNDGWASGSFGGAQDAQLPNSDNTYDFVLTAAMANAINNRVALAENNEVYFTGEGGITVSGIELKTVSYKGGTNVTAYDLTMTDEKISVFDKVGDTSNLQTTTLAAEIDQDMDWGSGKRYGLKDIFAGKTLKADDIINVYCTAGPDLHAQLYWYDNGDVKYANSADNNKNTGWGAGQFGGAQDAQLINQPSEGGWYYDFVLTAQMAEAMNDRFASDKEVYFTGESGVKIHKVTFTTTKEATGSEEMEYHLTNLWTPARDNVVPMYGFEAAMWGFSSKNSEFDAFQSWGDPNGDGDTSRFHNIKLVEEYFAEHTDGWYSQQRSPEYWAAIAPRFNAEIGDWVLVALEPAKGTYANAEDKNSQCKLQLWNLETKDDGEGNISLTDNIYDFGGYTDLDIHSNSRYNKDYKYFYLKLDSEAKVNAAKNGLRFKGNNYTIHRIDWLHKTEDEVIEVTDQQTVYQIHVLPEAFKAHSQWNIVNFTAAGCLPSQDSSIDHNGTNVDASNPHKFAEEIYLNFATTQNHGYDSYDVEFYSYTPNDAGEALEFPIANYIGGRNDGDNMPVIELDGQTVEAFAGDYQPYDFSVATGYDHSHYVLKVADYETYECRHDDADDNHAMSKTWYKPLTNLVKGLETYGLYARVTLHKQGTGKSAVRRAPRLVKDALTNLDFEPLSGDREDNYILYSLPTVNNEKVNPVVLYNRVGIANNANIDPTMGIESIGADNADAPVEIYNLQGIRVGEMTPGQVYIVRQGSRVEKVIR